MSPMIITLSIPTQTMTPCWIPSGYSRCYCLLQPIKEQFLDQGRGISSCLHLVRVARTAWRRCRPQTQLPVLATHHLHLTSRPQKSWPITTPPLENGECCSVPFFLPRCQNESKKDTDWQNKAVKSNGFPNDESKHNTTPPVANANARSPAILS